MTQRHCEVIFILKSVNIILCSMWCSLFHLMMMFTLTRDFKRSYPCTYMQLSKQPIMWHQHIKSYCYRSSTSVKVLTKHQKVGKMWSQWHWHGMILEARQTSLSISEIADLLGFSVYSESPSLPILNCPVNLCPL